jgi:hypothetical protein
MRLIKVLMKHKSKTLTPAFVQTLAID